MSSDRIFLDANILFSAAYGSQGLDYFWELAKKVHYILLASRYVIEEAKHNLENPVQLKKLNEHLVHVEIVSEVDPGIHCPIDLPDKDKPVLMSAISAKADYLITGDQGHFGKYFGQFVMGVKISLARDYILSRLKG